MVGTPQSAIEFMRRQHASNSQAWKGMCQSSVRQAWGLPGGVNSAKDSLANCKAAGKFHPYDGSPLAEWEKTVPIGAPVWTDRPGGSTYGHIVLMGGFNPRIKRRITWSVDVVDSGGIDPVLLDAYRNSWGHQILGWGSYLNGTHLPLEPTGGSSPTKPPPPPKREGLDDMAPKDLEELIRKVVREEILATIPRVQFRDVAGGAKDVSLQKAVWVLLRGGKIAKGPKQASQPTSGPASAPAAPAAPAAPKRRGVRRG